MFLGQEREIWRPLIFTTVNMSDISRWSQDHRGRLRSRLLASETDFCSPQHQVVLSAANLWPRRCDLLRGHQKWSGLVRAVPEGRRPSHADLQIRRSRQRGRRQQAQRWAVAHGELSVHACSGRSLRLFIRIGVFFFLCSWFRPSWRWATWAILWSWWWTAQTNWWWGCVPRSRRRSCQGSSDWPWEASWSTRTIWWFRWVCFQHRKLQLALDLGDLGLLWVQCSCGTVCVKDPGPSFDDRLLCGRWNRGSTPAWGKAAGWTSATPGRRTRRSCGPAINTCDPAATFLVLDLPFLTPQVRTMCLMWIKAVC